MSTRQPQSETSLMDFIFRVVVAPIALFVVVTISVPFAVLNGFVAMKLWNWFPAPYFHLQPISFWMMFGLALLIKQYSYTDFTKDRKVDWGSMITTAIILPWLSLAIGYLVHIHIS